jgi:catechol 2,3-dioxygenase-like lactoylglutathione lyase family enzyme
MNASTSEEDVMPKVTYSMPVLFVTNIELSTRFYQELFDLEIEHDFGVNVMFKEGFSLWERQSALEIINGPHAAREYPPAYNVHQTMELYFETEELQAFFEELRSREGLELVHELREEPWAQRTVRFLDPDGFVVEVAEPMPAVVRRLADEGLTPQDITERTMLSLEAVRAMLT